ncbi:glyoxalase/bleomycin resistance/extradiol dioxygenase family protein [Rubrivivax gelatinosus]|nr:glyoxalase/bleomycin resistance/extradiol dioxygenase family protein [Rubrivivax gelatinosus]
MQLAHVALWTADLDAAAAFWRERFGAEIGAPYRSTRRPGFVSRFATLPGGGARLELMSAAWLALPPAREAVGWDHVAVSLGSAAAVDALAARCAADGSLLSPPRHTGDGFYEAVIAAPDGTRVEITA